MSFFSLKRSGHQAKVEVKPAKEKTPKGPTPMELQHGMQRSLRMSESHVIDFFTTLGDMFEASGVEKALDLAKCSATRDHKSNLIQLNMGWSLIDGALVVLKGIASNDTIPAVIGPEHEDNYRNREYGCFTFDFSIGMTRDDAVFNRDITMKTWEKINGEVLPAWFVAAMKDAIREAKH